MTIAMLTKKCSGCHEVVAREHFYRDKGGIFGLDNYCKHCRRLANNKRYRESEEYREAARAQAIAWGRAHPDRVNERTARYRDAHPNAMRVWVARHRAKKAGVPSTLTREAWLTIVARFRGMCAYCGALYETIDHIIPLKAGGPNAVGNVLPACAFCNNSKHNRSLDEWMQEDSWPSACA